MNAGNPQDESCITMAVVFIPGLINPNPTEGQHTATVPAEGPHAVCGDVAVQAHGTRGCER